MELTYAELRGFDRRMERMEDDLRAILKGQQLVISSQTTILLELSHLKRNGAKIMSALDELKQNMVDLTDLAQKYLDFIIEKDAIIAAKDAKIAELVAQLEAGDITIAELKSGVEQAVLDSQAAEDKMRAGLPGVPPVGGAPLNPSYPDLAAFDAAVTAYSGPEAVTRDGVTVKNGTTPSLDYFSHSADGSISTSGPTD